jgi:hypothetical protein
VTVILDSVHCVIFSVAVFGNWICFCQVYERKGAYSVELVLNTDLGISEQESQYFGLGALLCSSLYVH